MSILPPFLTTLFLCIACVNSAGPQYPCDPSKKLNTFPFCRTKLSIEERARDLVSRMNLTEKVQQMVNSAAGIPRLGVPSYEWWSEALHGVSNLGPGTKFAGNVPGATMFPQVIHTAATFNATLWELIGQTVSTEARAMHNEGLAGLTFWSPNVNIFRDPRWGRGQETPGEDPLVVSTYAVRYVRGLQGSAAAEGPLKVAACCKHYTAYDLDNWKGVQRFTFNAVVSQQDLDDTYDPPFKSCVVEGNVASVMCSYNQVNGVPTCADPALLAGTIRGKWRLNGYVVSDCDSVDVFYRQQKYTRTPEDAAAVAINAGLDLNCGRFLAEHTDSAVKLGKVNESRVDEALVNNFKVLMRLGWFDGNPATKHPYGSLSASDVCTPKHRQLALEAAQQGVVLLKNLAVLPLSKTDLTTLAVIGPNANVTTTMIGNYAGIACNYTTPLQALSHYAKTTKYAPGCKNVLCSDDSLIADAVNISKDADVTIVIVGGDQSLEAEALDRETLILPGHQQHLVSAIAKASKGPVILVIMSGGPFDISFATNDSSIAGMFWVGYPGELGGQAIADAVFGTVNPSGRLPVTWYPEEYTEIPMTNMRMRADPATRYPGRTYRFYSGKTIFRFGYGLSYTSFKYSLLSVSVNAQCVGMEGNRCTGVRIDGSQCRQLSAEVVVEVSNVGERDGDDVLMLFVSPPSDEGAPIKELVGFTRLHVPSHASRSVALEIDICRKLMNAQENSIKTGSFIFHVGDLQFPFEVVLNN